MNRKHIVVAVFWIDPIARCDHLVAVERGNDVLNHLLLVQTEFDRASTVNVKAQCGVIDVLWNICVRNSRHRADSPCQAGRRIERLLHIETGDLNIDRGGQTQVQHRVYHASRLEKHGYLGQLTLNQRFQTSHVLVGADAMLLA